jgi:hypothetical protein
MARFETVADACTIYQQPLDTVLRELRAATSAPTPGDPASADAAVALAAADDLAIDELSGTVYWVGNREIWSARLSSQ